MTPVIVERKDKYDIQDLFKIIREVLELYTNPSKIIAIYPES